MLRSTEIKGGGEPRAETPSVFCFPIEDSTSSPEKGTLASTSTSSIFQKLPEEEDGLMWAPPNGMSAEVRPNITQLSFRPFFRDR